MPDRSGCAVRAGTLQEVVAAANRAARGSRLSRRNPPLGWAAGDARKFRCAKCSGWSRPSLSRSSRSPGRCRLYGSSNRKPISFRAETVGEPLVWGIGGYPQFGALNFEGPVVNAACGRLGAGSQQEGEQQKNRRTHSSPGSINDRARLAQLAPPLKSVCCRTGMSRPLRCLRPRKPKLPTRANQRAALSAAG